MNTFEVSTAEKEAVGRDKGKIDIAAVEETLADDMDLDSEAAEEGRCGSLGPAICATLFCR
jgi:hypothetical protein